MTRLLLTKDQTVIREIALAEGRIKLGRSGHNDVVIDDPAISGEHAVIVVQGGDVCIEDLNSTNGTKVNGQPIQKHFLQKEDVIEFARYMIRFMEARRVATLPRLLVVSGPRVNQEVLLAKTLTTIGMPGGALAVIVRRPDGFYLRRMDAANAAEAGRQDDGAEEIMLKNGYEFHLVDSWFRFLDGGPTTTDGFL